MATTAPAAAMGIPQVPQSSLQYWTPERYREALTFSQGVNNASPEAAKPIYDTVTTTVSAPAASASVSKNDGLDEYKALLNQIKAEKAAQVNAAYNQGVESLNNAKAAADKDAYVAYMQGLKNMPQIAAMGGNGGYAQSLLNKQQLNFENNRSGIKQNYLDNLRELESARANGLVSANQDYLAEMAGFIKSMPATTTAAATPATTTQTNNVFSGKYKVGSKTMSRDEYLAYLAGYGMTGEQAADYMAKNNIPY